MPSENQLDTELDELLHHHDELCRLLEAWNRERTAKEPQLGAEPFAKPTPISSP